MPRHGFGAWPLLELELYDSDAEMAVREHIFAHRTLNSETLGDIWCWHHARPQQWFNPAVAVREWRTYAEQQRQLEAVERERLQNERAVERETVARIDARHAARVRARAAREALVRAEQERLAAIDHEHKRKWAIHTSDVERRITQIVDTIDANSRDREMMRAILRYMFLGPGIGTRWDVKEFAQYYRGIDVFSYYAHIDAERCYLMLRESIGCRSQSLAI